MSQKTKEFILGLKEVAKEHRIELDGLMFDYNTYEEYEASHSEEDNKYEFFSLEKRKPYRSISFRIDVEKETVSLVASNGYDYFEVGSPKDMNKDNIYDVLLTIAVSLID